MKGMALVLLPNWVGDGAMAVPALRALTTARPDLRWILVGTERSAPLYGRWPCEAVIPMPAGSSRATLALAGRLRGLKLESALVLSPSFRAALIPWIAGVRRRIGWRTDGRFMLLTDSVPFPGRKVHLARSYLALAAQLGADPNAACDPLLPIGADEREAARTRLGAIDVEGARTIALFPGATYGETKRWPYPHWVSLGRGLHERGWSLLVLGGADERAVAAKLCAEIGDGAARSLAGDLTLRESLAILSCVAAAVSNDSGGMHLAAAAGAATLGIFGSTSPAWTGPLGPRVRAVSLGLPCAPCFGRTCPTRIECLRDLSPARIVSELDALITREAGASR